jgi:hypothetical protein
VVEGLEGEVECHELHDGLCALECCSHCHPCEADLKGQKNRGESPCVVHILARQGQRNSVSAITYLCDGGVPDPLGAVLLQQSPRDFVCSLVLSHLLSNDEYLRKPIEWVHALKRQQADQPSRPGECWPCATLKAFRPGSHRVVPSHLLVHGRVKGVTNRHLQPDMLINKSTTNPSDSVGERLR